MVGFFVAPPRTLSIGCVCTPAYVTGNRTASITVTGSNAVWVGAGAYAVHVNGAFGSDADAFVFDNANAVVGHTIRYDFGVGAHIKITEAKWYQSNTGNHGTWKWQGSDDASAWTDIGTSLTLGGATVQTQTSLAANTVGYRYYQLLGVSGNFNAGIYNEEIEFNQCAC